VSFVFQPYALIFSFAAAPVLFLTFALSYAQQRRWLERRYVVLLWIVPALTLLMTFTNNWHHLLWNSFTPSPAGQNILVYGRGLWFWPFVVYSYTVLALGTLLLFGELFKRRHGFYRREALILVIGLLVSWRGVGRFCPHGSPRLAQPLQPDFGLRRDARQL